MAWKIMQTLAFVLITLILAAPAFGAPDDAVSDALTNPTPVGWVQTRVYTYENQQYVLLEYNDLETGETNVLSISDKNNDYVTNADMIKKIAYSYYFLSDINTATAALFNEAAADTKTDAALYNTAGSRIEKNASRDVNPQITKDFADAYSAIGATFLLEAQAYDKIAGVQNDVVKDVRNKSYENAQKIETGYQELLTAWEQELKDAKQFQKAQNAYYDMLIENPGLYGVDKNKITEEKRDKDAEAAAWINDIETDIEHMKNKLGPDKNKQIDRIVYSIQSRNSETTTGDGAGNGTGNNTNSVPGFSLLAAVSAFLMAGLVIKKQKK